MTLIMPRRLRNVLGVVSNTEPRRLAALSGLDDLRKTSYLAREQPPGSAGILPARSKGKNLRERWWWPFRHRKSYGQARMRSGQKPLFVSGKPGQAMRYGRSTRNPENQNSTISSPYTGL